MNEIIRTAPQIVSVLSDPANFWVNIVLASVTFGALLIALFQEKIRIWWRIAKLDMEINLNPPDSHQIDMKSPFGEFLFKSIYIRVKVLHKSGSSAENVEIMPISFSKVLENDKVECLSYFLPINLAWSHFQPRTSTMRVPAGLFRHCDFGHFKKNGEEALLVLDTMIQPNSVSGGEVPNQIKPGKYIFELLLSGDNVKPLLKRWEIEFKEWSEDESEMLDKYIKIRAL